MRPHNQQFLPNPRESSPLHIHSACDHESIKDCAETSDPSRQHTGVHTPPCPWGKTSRSQSNPTRTKPSTRSRCYPLTLSLSDLGMHAASLWAERLGAEIEELTSPLSRQFSRPSPGHLPGFMKMRHRDTAICTTCAAGDCAQSSQSSNDHSKRQETGNGRKMVEDG